MARCRIRSVQTEYILISNGKETDGSIVATVPRNELNLDTTIVKIDPPLFGPSPTIGVVQSIRVPDLFVGYKSVDGQLFLAWTREPFPWVFTSPEKAEFNIRPANGGDLYWFDKLGVGINNRIALKTGKDVQEHENVFFITSA